MVAEQQNEVGTLMDALITKMERMDGEMRFLRYEVQRMQDDPMTILKRAGYVRMETPATEDVWGDPLRGAREGVISKAAEGFDSMMEMPATNEEWHEMSWEAIHKMADNAGPPTNGSIHGDPGSFVTTRREDEKS
jgi:hypothetical protein